MYQHAADRDSWALQRLLGGEQNNRSGSLIVLPFPKGK